MTGRIWSTSETSNPPKTTITQETTVTYSTIENNVERVNVCPPLELLEYWLTDVPGYGRKCSTQLKWQKAGQIGALFEPQRRPGGYRFFIQETQTEIYRGAGRGGHAPEAQRTSQALSLGARLRVMDPSLDARTWPETVYHLEYRRADGGLAERIVKAEPFTGKLPSPLSDCRMKTSDSESTDLLSEHKIEAKIDQNFAVSLLTLGKYRF